MKLSPDREGTLSISIILGRCGGLGSLSFPPVSRFSHLNPISSSLSAVPLGLAVVEPGCSGQRGRLLTLTLRGTAATQHMLFPSEQDCFLSLRYFQKFRPSFIEQVRKLNYSV